MIMFVRKLNQDPSVFMQVKSKLDDVAMEINSYQTFYKSFTNDDLVRLEKALFNLELRLLFHKRNPYYTRAQLLKKHVRSFESMINSLRDNMDMYNKYARNTISA